MDKCNDYGAMVNSADLEDLQKTLKYQIDEFGCDVKTFKNMENAPVAVSPPVLVKNVALSSQLNMNEVNGPYVMLIPFRTVKESVALINTSRFGSGVSLHSQNISLGKFQ